MMAIEPAQFGPQAQKKFLSRASLALQLQATVWASILPKSGVRCAAEVFGRICIPNKDFP
jgi:hypothetical protein